MSIDEENIYLSGISYLDFRAQGIRNTDHINDWNSTQFRDNTQGPSANKFDSHRSEEA